MTMNLAQKNRNMNKQDLRYAKNEGSMLNYTVKEIQIVQECKYLF